MESSARLTFSKTHKNFLKITFTVFLITKPSKMLFLENKKLQNQKENGSRW